MALCAQPATQPPGCARKCGATIGDNAGTQAVAMTAHAPADGVSPASPTTAPDHQRDSLWRSVPLLVVLLVVAAGALLPSFVAVREYAAHVGAHRQLIWGAPLCLDGLALAAAYAWIDRHTRGLPSGSAPLSAVGAALATLAVNALHANPDLIDPVVGLVALSLLAPVAAFAAFHLVFESLTQHRTIALNATTAHETSRAQDPGRDHANAQQAATAQPVAHPQAAEARTRFTRTISTKETKITELIDEVTDHTVRQIVADWLADGGDVHDPALTARVERALGRSRRTAQLHLQPARRAAANATNAAPTPSDDRPRAGSFRSSV
jgi:hypothetical protein